MRSTRNDTDTNDHVAGQDRPREMKSTGKAREALQSSHIELVDGPLDRDHAKNLAFNEEPVTIVVHDTSDPTDEPIPYVINGGRRQGFKRGVEQTVKRKFVEVLARMKRTTYSQEKFKDSQSIDQIRNLPHTALRFPFTVVNDANPRGRDWLKGILSEA